MTITDLWTIAGLFLAALIASYLTQWRLNKRKQHIQEIKRGPFWTTTFGWDEKGQPTSKSEGPFVRDEDGRPVRISEDEAMEIVVARASKYVRKGK